MHNRFKNNLKHFLKFRISVFEYFEHIDIYVLTNFKNF